MRLLLGASVRTANGLNFLRQFLILTALTANCDARGGREQTRHTPRAPRRGAARRGGNHRLALLLPTSTPSPPRLRASPTAPPTPPHPARACACGRAVLLSRNVFFCVCAAAAAVVAARLRHKRRCGARASACRHRADPCRRTVPPRRPRHTRRPRRPRPPRRPRRTARARRRRGDRRSSRPRPRPRSPQRTPPRPARARTATARTRSARHPWRFWARPPWRARRWS